MSRPLYCSCSLGENTDTETCRPVMLLIEMKLTSSQTKNKSNNDKAKRNKTQQTPACTEQLEDEKNNNINYCIQLTSLLYHPKSYFTVIMMNVQGVEKNA